MQIPESIGLINFTRTRTMYRHRTYVHSACQFFHHPLNACISSCLTVLLSREFRGVQLFGNFPPYHYQPAKHDLVITDTKAHIISRRRYKARLFRRCETKRPRQSRVRIKRTPVNSHPWRSAV